MLIMGRASAGRSQQLVCEYRDWYFFVCSRKNEIICCCAKNQAVFSVGKRFHLNLYRNCEEKMKNHENTSVYFEDS